MGDIKFKVFNFPDGNDWVESVQLKLFTQKVNDFLQKNEIIDVQKEQRTEKVETWFACGVKTYISYLIKYKEKNKKLK